MQETQETRVWSLGREDPLEEEMPTHSRILAWKFPCTEEPGGLQSMGSQRVRHSWAQAWDRKKENLALKIGLKQGFTNTLSRERIFKCLYHLPHRKTWRILPTVKKRCDTEEREEIPSSSSSQGIWEEEKQGKEWSGWNVLCRPGKVRGMRVLTLFLLRALEKHHLSSCPTPKSKWRQLGRQTARSVVFSEHQFGSRRSSREGNGYPLQYSCLEKSRTEEPGRIQPLGSQRVRRTWTTNTFTLSWLPKGKYCGKAGIPGFSAPHG